MYVKRLFISIVLRFNRTSILFKHVFKAKNKKLFSDFVMQENIDFCDSEPLLIITLKRLLIKISLEI